MDRYGRYPMTAPKQMVYTLLLAGMYFGASWSITHLGRDIGFALAIFPAAGIALGALLCWGVRLWPGVWLGAFGFNLYFFNYITPLTDTTVFQEILIASGLGLAQVAQALFGVFLFRRFIPLPNPLNRIRDVLAFIFMVGVVGCTVSGFLSLLILTVTGHLPWNQFAGDWLIWWLGDVMGVLLAAPLFFVFHQPQRFQWARPRLLEAGLLLLLFYVTSQVVFGGGLSYHQYPLVYMLFPCLVWAAYRFGPPGAVIAILLVSLAAVWGTLKGQGPFALRSIDESLGLVEAYLLVLTVMTLVLTAAVTQAEEVQMQAVRFGRILDESSNEIYLFDAQTLRFIQVNRGARENLGYTLEEMQSLTPLDLKLDFTRQDFEAILKPLRRGTDNLVVFQTHHQRKDGTVYPVEVRVQLSRAEIYPVFVAVSLDITEKQKTEKELAGYRNHLEDLVIQRTNDLEEAHRQLLHAEKLSATGKMAASMAHEFNNPIYGIRNVLEKILRRVKLGVNNRRFVKLAIQECDRITGLIRKILDFHSPSPENKERMDVHEAIEDMVLLVQNSFKERNIRVVKEFAVDLPCIEAVPDQFKQVILNLLQNAGEAIPKRGGTVTLITSVLENNVQIQIKDTGAGIPKEVMKNIFDPFFSTKVEVKGTGLGLSVSYGIIKKHHGEIMVDSFPGRGTTFTLFLPIKQETPVALSRRA